MDLLTHRYRPNSTENFGCNPGEARRLREWIQDFLRASGASATGSKHKRKKKQTSNNLDDTSSDTDSNCSDDIGNIDLINKCALITGPPGIGKTSLVYSVANELKLHVIESHPSEKRDFKLFSTLKLANQKGKINPIAKLFQAAQTNNDRKHEIEKKQQINMTTGSRSKKRIKLSNPLQTIPSQQATTHKEQTQQILQHNETQGLSLSGDSSILLFDDIDVVFDEDGPFIKSLVEFIKETKRPVVMTATKSIEFIKDALVCFEHIELRRPLVEDCAKLLSNICKTEQYSQISKITNCRQLADHLNCDIRQCLNRIHFFGDQANKNLTAQVDIGTYVQADLLKLQLDDLLAYKRDNDNLLNCFTTTSLIDIMDFKLNMRDKGELLYRWLDGKPSYRNEEFTSDLDLGQQIRESILELNDKIAQDELMTEEHIAEIKDWKEAISRKYHKMASCVNERIKSRIEPPDREFYIDIVPQFCELVTLEQKHKIKMVMSGASGRRSRRNFGYLDSIAVYLDSRDFKTLSDGMLDLTKLDEFIQ